MDSIIWLSTHKSRFPAHDYFITPSVCLNGHFQNFPNSSNLPHPCNYGSIGVFLSVRLGVPRFSLSGVCGSGKTITFCIIRQLKHSCRDWYLVLDIPGYYLEEMRREQPQKRSYGIFWHVKVSISQIPSQIPQRRLTDYRLVTPTFATLFSWEKRRPAVLRTRNSEKARVADEDRGKAQADAKRRSPFSLPRVTSDDIGTLGHH